MTKRIYRQVDRGSATEPTLVHEEGRPLPCYVDRSFDSPLLPGWRVESKWVSNWDLGPGLRRDTRVFDSAEPFSDAFTMADDVMKRAESLAHELVERLRVWGAGDPRVFVWHLGEIEDIDSSSDVLMKRAVILDELVQLATDVVPSEIPDPCGAFGPDGPPIPPRAIVGRRLDQLPDPIPITSELRDLGVDVAVVGDEIRLALVRP
jgi:hypothetical protein